MHVIPDLADNRSSTVSAVLLDALVRGIISRSAATQVRHSPRLLGQLALDVCQGVGGGVARGDIGFLQPTPGWESLVVLDRSLEELDDFLVLDVVGPVAREVERREAGRVLGEFVGPEVRVWRTLIDPVCVHPLEKVEGSESFDECAYTRAFVGWYGGAIGKAGGGVGRGHGIVLATQVAIRFVRPIAQLHIR